MLLREFDQGNDFISSLETALNLYLDQANDKDELGKIDYATLGRLMGRVGSYGSVNHKVIDAALGQSEALKTLIQNYDSEGITLNTNKEPPANTAAQQPDMEKTDQGISKTTAQAASSAAQQSLAN